MESVESGLPILRTKAVDQGHDAVVELERMTVEFQRYLPGAAP